MNPSVDFIQNKNLLNIYIVDEDKVRKFYESFETTVQRVDKDVEIIREWLKIRPHLPELMGKSIYL
jgi:ribosomal protein L15E